MFDLATIRAMNAPAAIPIPTRPVYEAKIGLLVFYDSFSGLLPAKIIEIHPHKYDKFTLVITGQKRRGEVVASTPLHVIPRDRTYVRSGQFRIKPHAWII